MGPVEKRHVGKEGRICRFVRYPYKECYCAELNSFNIAMILRYCENDFEHCDVYQRLAGKSLRQAGNPAD